MRKKYLLTVSCIIPALLLSGIVFSITFLHSFFTHTVSEKKIKKISIVCTTSIIADVVKELCAPFAETRSLIGPGIDPHTYRTKPSDMKTLLEADIIFHNGLHLEGKMIELIEHLKEEKIVIAVTEMIDRTALIESTIPGIYDPHVWSDPLLFIHCVDCIYKTVNTVLFQNSDKTELEQRYKSYVENLLATHRAMEQQISVLEQKKRVLVTAHDAFEYFARRYQFIVYALQGVSTEVDIGLADVNSLIDFIVAHQVHAIFVESCIPYRSMEAIQERTQMQGWNVTIGGELYSDSLGDVSSRASTYIKMLEHNTKTIVTALTQEHSS